jgi:hypothetical protein
MAFVRAFQSGRYSAESQHLLNELSNARITLLDQAKRLAYDQQLRGKLAARLSAAIPIAQTASSLPSTASNRSTIGAPAATQAERNIYDPRYLPGIKRSTPAQHYTHWLRTAISGNGTPLWESPRILVTIAATLAFCTLLGGLYFGLTMRNSQSEVAGPTMDAQSKDDSIDPTSVSSPPTGGASLSATAPSSAG